MSGRIIKTWNTSGPLSASTPSKQGARWALFFTQFNFSITYRPGSCNVKPNALSQQFTTSEGDWDPGPVLPASCMVGAVTWEIKALIRGAQDTESDPGTGPCPHICLVTSSPVGPHRPVHLPPRNSLHYHLLTMLFCWPTLVKDTREYVNACSTCAQNKLSNQPLSGLLRLLPTPGWPWSHIALDFIMGLPASSVNMAILNLVDHFSKAAHIVALTSSSPIAALM